MRAEWAPKETLELLLTAMMPANRLAIRASMATGLRIGDVLAFTALDGEGTEDREAQARLFARKALRGHISPGGADMGL